MLELVVSELPARASKALELLGDLRWSHRRSVEQEGQCYFPVAFTQNVALWSAAEAFASSVPAAEKTLSNCVLGS